MSDSLLKSLISRFVVMPVVAGMLVVGFFYEFIEWGRCKLGIVD